MTTNNVHPAFAEIIAEFLAPRTAFTKPQEIEESEDGPEIPRCEAYLIVRMPYDSGHETARVQCRGPEDHASDEHDFEHIEGNRGSKGPFWPKAKKQGPYDIDLADADKFNDMADPSAIDIPCAPLDGE